MAIWAITPNGLTLGQKILRHFPDARIFLSDKFSNVSDISCRPETLSFFKKLSDAIEKAFYQYDAHLFVFSTGIAVRMISPFVKSKRTDPAVVVVDDGGRFAVSLLSGHIGGANRLAETIGRLINAQPVITTATDANRLPAIDMIALDMGLFIETPQNIKYINMAILEDTPIHCKDRLKLLSPVLDRWTQKETAGLKNTGAAILCSPFVESVSRETMVLRPPLLVAGIGCNRGTPMADIKNFLVETFDQNNLSFHSLCRLASVDIKSDEAGLTSLASSLGVEIDFFGADALNKVDRIRTPSKMAEKHIGVKSVCEASAILAADRLSKTGQGELILTKQKNRDVTVAVAIVK